MTKSSSWVLVAVVLAVAAFFVGRTSAPTHEERFVGTVKLVSGDQSVVQIKTTSGAIINATLANAGAALTVGQSVSGVYYESPEAVVFVKPQSQTQP